MADKEIRCVVVGYGPTCDMGKFHATQISRVDGLVLAGVCDIVDERCKLAAEDWDVPTYASLDEVVEQEDVDMVSLVTPHDTHCPLTLQALEAGKHVLTEKVMCLNVDEADRMIAAADESGKMFTVFQNRRLDRDYLTVKHLIEAGELGDVFHIETSITGWAELVGWRREAEHGGGNLYDWGAHMIDQVVQIARCRPKTVYANQQNQVWDVDVTTHDTVQIEFENGMLVTLVLSGVAMAERRRWHVYGTQGTLTKKSIFDVDEPFKLHKEIAGNRVSIDYPVIEKEGGDHLWDRYYENIAAHLLRGEKLAVNPYEVRWGIAIIEAAMLSSKERRAVDIADITTGPFSREKRKETRIDFSVSMMTD